MKISIKQLITAALCLTICTGVAQEDENEGSVIQTLTPSKLIGKGTYDIKWFNNLYTETESTFADGTQPRQTFFTSTLEAYTGVGNSKRVNLGVILEARSNVINDRDALDVFSFDGESGTARSGLTSIAPSVKFVPFAKANNFSIQSSFFIPLVDNEVENGVFLDQKGFTWQNRFFYDHTFTGDKFQVFGELNGELHFGNEDDSFANNSISLTPGVFLSYFPSSKFTVLALAQHSQRLSISTFKTTNDAGVTTEERGFEQDFTAVGGGAKYQLTDQLNIEALYTNFVRGNNTGLGQTFNLGLRAVL